MKSPDRRFSTAEQLAAEQSLFTAIRDDNIKRMAAYGLFGRLKKALNARYDEEREQAARLDIYEVDDRPYRFDMPSDLVHVTFRTHKKGIRAVTEYPTLRYAVPTDYDDEHGPVVVETDVRIGRIDENGEVTPSRFFEDDQAKLAASMIAGLRLAKELDILPNLSFNLDEIIEPGAGRLASK